VSAEGRLRIGVGVVCSSSYVSSSVTFGVSVGGSVGCSFDFCLRYRRPWYFAYSACNGRRR
jgi:hypothetical protein